MFERRVGRFFVCAFLLVSPACVSGSPSGPDEEGNGAKEPGPAPGDPGETGAGGSPNPGPAPPLDPEPGAADPQPQPGPEPDPQPEPDPSPEPDPGTPPADAGAPSAPDVAPSGAPDEPGLLTIAVGMRISLDTALTTRWTGQERRSISENDGKPVFTGVFSRGQFGGPRGHTARLAVRPGREYLFEYKIRFDGDFPWTKGGKIPGLGGGNAPTGCTNVNANGFSARMMWRAGGELVGYVYDQDQSGGCGRDLGTGHRFRPNTWYSIKERVRLNTGGNRDGILEIWVDGRKVLDGRRRYMSESPDNRINVVLFHAFFGGGNASFAPSRDASISFSEAYVTLVEE